MTAEELAAIRARVERLTRAGGREWWLPDDAVTLLAEVDRLRALCERAGLVLNAVRYGVNGNSDLVDALMRLAEGEG